MENLNRKEMNNIENASERKSNVKYNGSENPESSTGPQKRVSKTSQSVLKKRLSRVEEEPNLPNLSTLSFRKANHLLTGEYQSKYKDKDASSYASFDNRSASDLNTSTDKIAPKYISRDLLRKQSSKYSPKSGVGSKKSLESTHSVTGERRSEEIAPTYKPSETSRRSTGPFQISRNSMLPNLNTNNDEGVNQSVESESSSSNDTIPSLGKNDLKSYTKHIIRTPYTSAENFSAKKYSKAENKEKTSLSFNVNANRVPEYDDDNSTERDTPANRLIKRVSLSHRLSQIPHNVNHFRMQQPLFDSISATIDGQPFVRPVDTVKTTNGIDVTSASKYHIDETYEQELSQNAQDISKVGLASERCALLSGSSFTGSIGTPPNKNVSVKQGNDVSIVSASKYGIDEAFDREQEMDHQSMSRMGLASRYCAMRDSSMLSNEKISPMKSVTYANKFSETETKSCECWKICTCKSKNDITGNKQTPSPPASTSGYTQHTITIVTNNVPPNNYMANYAYGFDNSISTQGSKS